MIGLRDSVTLARTKVRSKRIRLLVTTIVSGLLFGLISGGILLFDGTAASISRFADQNLGGRYLVQGTPVVDGAELFADPADPKVRDEVVAQHWIGQALGSLEGHVAPCGELLHERPI